jgi:hypothetical protein
MAHTIVPLHQFPIPANPAGAVEVDGWRLDGGTARPFTGTKRTTVLNRGDDVHVDIMGCQCRDGSVDRRISLNGNHFLGASEARELARVLIAAADEMAGYDQEAEQR